MSAEYLRSLHCENGSGQYPYVCCAQTFNQFGGGQWQHQAPAPTPPPQYYQPQQPHQSPSTRRQATTHLAPSTSLVRANPSPTLHHQPQPQPQYSQQPQQHQHQHQHQPRALSGAELPGPGVCGLTSLAHRIFGGEETNIDDYSWIALLEYQPRKYIHIN